MLNWANQFNICCFLDNHNYPDKFTSFECLVGVGAIDVFEPSIDFFSSLSTFVNAKSDWLFGHFNYDLKNKIEHDLTSDNTDNIEFPECFLFQPEITLQLIGDFLTIGVFTDNASEIFNQVIHIECAELVPVSLMLHPTFSRKEYLKIVNKLIDHIQRGDCYVINFCMEFSAYTTISPHLVFLLLNKISPNPFSAFYKLHDKYVMGASPERYLKKEGNKIISQPIKGTAARNIDPGLDEKLKVDLYNSTKDRSENVMVVDLVRNDLSKICKEGSVKVDELFGIYSFPNVHQMISTVSGNLEEGVDFADIIKATFPMGSMTGAPKKKVMELIETYEKSKRGIYSGTIGYISPDKNFDFNVVIRSLFYNQKRGYLSFQAGSAITSYSDPNKEYEECLLKGKAIMELFGSEQLGK